MQITKSIQLNFRNSIFKINNENEEFIKSSFSKERLNIYRQTIYENMRNALSIIFPGVWVLIGAECANNIAYKFYTQQVNLPSTGCIDHWGENFPKFLKEQQELKNIIYIEDYANYEWLKHLAYGTKTKNNAIKIEELASITQEKVEFVKLIFSPSSYLYKSKHEIHKIIEIVENPNAKEISLNNILSYAIICRTLNIVYTYWIKEDLFHFIEKLKNGYNISESLNLTEEIYPNFDIADSIAFIFKKKLIEEIIY